MTILLSDKIRFQILEFSISFSHFPFGFLEIQSGPESGSASICVVGMWQVFLTPLCLNHELSVSLASIIFFAFFFFLGFYFIFIFFGLCLQNSIPQHMRPDSDTSEGWSSFTLFLFIL